MTFKEAVEEMKKLAEGRDWSLQYEVTSWQSLPQIRGYVDVSEGKISLCATTYQEAINNVKRMLGQLPSDEAPTDD